MDFEYELLVVVSLVLILELVALVLAVALVLIDVALDVFGLVLDVQTFHFDKTIVFESLDTVMDLVLTLFVFVFQDLSSP